MMRGRKDEENVSSLLKYRESDNARRQCCVGIFLSATGLPDEVILDKSAVFTLYEADVRGRVLEACGGDRWLFGDSDTSDMKEVRPDVCVAYTTNDSDTLSEADREEQVAAIFAKHGVVVTFVN